MQGTRHMRRCAVMENGGRSGFGDELRPHSGVRWRAGMERVTTTATTGMKSSDAAIGDCGSSCELYDVLLSLLLLYFSISFVSLVLFVSIFFSVYVDFPHPLFCVVCSIGSSLSEED
ncbi:hypothetical protein SESBI_21073 [Sesbania bispinosa]|nr:hypothetical protein SESBI_21073 [Sesbania bispinosa]